MQLYKIQFYNDMGHLLIQNQQTIPEHIQQFAYSKVKLYIRHATDNSGRGCMFYILKDGLQPKWTYYYEANIAVEIDWSDCLPSRNKSGIRFI